jgi:hypothetical protein
MIKKIFINKLDKKIASLAVLLLKGEEDISAEDEMYIKSLKCVSKLVDVDPVNYDFLIDLIKGDPVLIFKCKNPEVLNLPEDIRPDLMLENSRISQVT